MKPIFAVPAITFLIHRAWTKNSLTPVAIVIAALTAVIHAAHPWNTPFVLLAAFFLAGTRVTNISKDMKEKLTESSRGTSGGEGPRNHWQVLANSAVATILVLMHMFQLQSRRKALPPAPPVVEGAEPDYNLAIERAVAGGYCFPWHGDLLPIGIIANYAAVAADTFSSELGILSSSAPRLITSLTLRVVPRGTNGGVTIMGLGAGLFGSLLLVTSAMLSLPLCEPPESFPAPIAGEGPGAFWTTWRRGVFMWGITLVGFCGTLIDSFLGATLQRTVKDVRTGKVIEGEGGARVLVTDERHDERVRAAVRAAAHGGGAEADASQAVEETDAVGSKNTGARKRVTGKSKKTEDEKARKESFGDGPSRTVESGLDILDNNQVNLVTAAITSVLAMAAVSFFWGIPLSSIFEF